MSSTKPDADAVAQWGQSPVRMGKPVLVEIPREVELVAHLDQALDALQFLYLQFFGTGATWGDGSPIYINECIAAAKQAERVLLTHDRIAKDKQHINSYKATEGLANE